MERDSGSDDDSFELLESITSGADDHWETIVDPCGCQRFTRAVNQSVKKLKDNFPSPPDVDLRSCKIHINRKTKNLTLIELIHRCDQCQKAITKAKLRL